MILKATRRRTELWPDAPIAVDDPGEPVTIVAFVGTGTYPGPSDIKAVVVHDDGHLSEEYLHNLTVDTTPELVVVPAPA